ncbi:MAG TPA: DUF881 domain-containing protein [Bacillota bacterium]|jgi:hypothetical protein|nr:DUF881 domain-containing protein [Bacillota bacterium]HOB86336.1 DUF881 domain-containing protein [Bacillota bacterium]HOP69460.1 DUF881 domain-containing protein [Bacillota bacterium]HPT34434.1 DUF881 domain-containing protein [Bacillota bacterium]HQD06428.1 DUF881 domain-containing protein [Bacillota bacterium]
MWSEQMGESWRRKGLLLVVALLAVNTVLLGWVSYILYQNFPSAATRLDYKQEAALDLAEYNRRLAAELGVLDSKTVQEALAAFNYDVEMAASSDELSQIILKDGRRIQEIILREANAKLLDQIVAVINQDKKIRETKERTRLTIKIGESQVTVIPELLEAETVARIKELIPGQGFAGEQSIEIEIVDGVSRVMVPLDLEEHLQALTEELDSLRLLHHELKVSSGMEQMTGPGIIVSIYDEEGATTNTSIVHDADIRDVVNELFGSGAQGVSVGGQRLVVNSSIRCSGSLIKVNDKLITVNPVVIKAVGDPDLLESGLDIISNTLAIRRGIRMEITRSDSITLPAYTRSAGY